MSHDKSKNSVKGFSKFVSQSSQQLLAAFLGDDFKNKYALQDLKKQIKQACKQQAFVVLQINESTNPNAPFETVSGKLKLNRNNPNLVILVEQRTQKIRMVPLEHIRKISFLKGRISPSTSKQHSRHTL